MLSIEEALKLPFKEEVDEVIEDLRKIHFHKPYEERDVIRKNIVALEKYRQTIPFKTPYLPIDKCINLEAKEIRLQVSIRQNIMSQMVGTLYPSILQDEINQLLN